MDINISDSMCFTPYKIEVKTLHEHEALIRIAKESSIDSGNSLLRALEKSQNMANAGVVKHSFNI